MTIKVLKMSADNIMSKYILNFVGVGESTVDVDLIEKDFNGSFLISTWINRNTNETEYKLRTSDIKTRISKSQSMEIVDKLHLQWTQDATFNSGGVYRLKTG